MDRPTVSAAIVFAALGIVGIFLAVSPASLGMTGQAVSAVTSLGSALFGAGLAAFLVVAFLRSTRASSG